jgi:hypothetical protein
MKAGWGFHVSLEALAKSAYVWQHLRAFRLVRARHAAELGTKNAVNLASLPQEIIDIIEDELALSAYDLITAKEPFHFPCIDCDAFWDELHDSKQHNDALERFQASYIRDNLPKSIDADEALDSDGELYYDLEEQAFEAFSDTTADSPIRKRLRYVLREASCFLGESCPLYIVARSPQAD